MQHKNFFLKSKWLVTIIVLSSLNIGQMWGLAGDEIDEVANIISGKRYYIKGVRSNGTVQYLSFSDATGNSVSGTGVTSQASAIPLTFTYESSKWYITTPNGYYVTPAASNGKLIVTSTKTSVSLTDHESYYLIKIQGASYYLQKNSSADNFGGYNNTQTDVTLIQAPNSSKYTVSFASGTGNPSVSSRTETSASGGITLPSVTPACSSDGWELFGWAETSCATSTTTGPIIVGQAGGTYYPESNTTLYAVYRQKVSDTPTSITYTLNGNWTSSNGNWTRIDGSDLDGSLASGKYGLNSGSSTAISPITFSDISEIKFTGSKSGSGAGSVEFFYGTTTSWTTLTSKDIANTLTWSISPLKSGRLKIKFTRTAGNIYIASMKITYKPYNYFSNPTCASCDANPTIGAASLNGTFSLSSVGVRCPTSGTAVQDNCEWEDYGFVWGTNNTGTRPDLTSDASNKVQTGTSGTDNTWDDDLESTFTTGITYYYRAYGENGHGLAYGDVASFTPYKVYYNANGGTGSIDDQIVNTGGSVTLSDGTGFSKDGYHITKWALGSASGTQSDPSSSSGSVTANKEYYAIWTANTYTVTFDKNGGSGDAMSGQAFTYGTAQNLSANTYTAPDHMYFLGWNTDKDATTALYGNNESVNNLTTTNNGTVTLYAIWKEHTYTAYRTNCCTKPTFTISGTGKSETIDGTISFPVLREDLSGVPSSTWAELEITISSNSSGAITIIEGTGGDAGKTAWKLSSWESRNTDGGTIATTDHATFTNPSAGNYLFKVKTTAGGGYTGQGTYRIGIQQAANGDYCAATVYLWVDVTLRDKFVDQLNGNGTVNLDGHGAQLAAPSLSDLDTQVENACHSEGRKLKGWIKETDLKAKYETGNSERVQTIDGLCETCDNATPWTSLVVAPGENVTTSGATWYAVWAYEK